MCKRKMSTVDRDDLYVDNYYDYNAQDHVRMMYSNATGKSEGSSSATLWRVILAILLRIGFLLVQIGSVPVGNVNLILLQNIVDFCAVTVVYILVGFIAAFNGDIAGLVGEGYWIGNLEADKNEAMVGWGAIVTASAICTCGIVGRMHTVGYLVVAVLLSGVVQPFLIHWAWTTNGWMFENSLASKRVSFRDYAGAGTVHIVGSLSGLIGCMTLGRRILRLRDLDDASLPADSPGSAFAGYLLIFLGLQGLTLPSPVYDTTRASIKHVPNVIINNLLAASACSLFVVALHFALSREAFNYWTVMRCVQGAISGVVTVAAGVDIYSPLVAVGISCAGGAVFYLVSRRVYRSALEDYCNIVATHLACALLGSFIAPLCGTPAGVEPDSHAMILDVAWQVICLVSVLTLVVITMGPFFLFLELFGFLRNRSEYQNNLRAVIALERGPPRSYMQRLFFPDAETLYLQPGTAAKSGQGTHMISPRLWRYKHEIKKLEDTRPKALGGNRLDDAPAEPSQVEGYTEPIQVTRVKKARQIYTLRMGSPKRTEDSGGTGESVNDDHLFALARRGKTHEDWIDPMQGSSKTQEAPRAEVATETSMDNVLAKLDSIEQYCLTEVNYKNLYSSSDLKAQVLKRPANANQDGRPHKQPRYYLHRTPKLTDLHSKERDDQNLGPHEINVKVLVEPRQEQFVSSDSEDERIVEESSDKLRNRLEAISNVGSFLTEI